MPIVGKCNNIYCNNNKNRQCELGEVWIEYGDRVAFCADQDDEGWEKRVEKIGGIYFQKKK